MCFSNIPRFGRLQSFGHSIIIIITFIIIIILSIFRLWAHPGRLAKLNLCYRKVGRSVYLPLLFLCLNWEAKVWINLVSSIIDY